MNHNKVSTASHLLILITFVSLLLGACAPGASGTAIASADGLSVWLDQAPNGSVLPLAPFILKAHARDASGGGVTEIDFKVNDIILGTVTTNASAALAYAELPWNPSAPGSYTIEAWGVNLVGAKVSSAVATVCVTDATGSGCSGPIQPPMIAPTLAPEQLSCEQLKNCTATPIPTATPKPQSCEQLKNCTPTPTPTATATPKPIILIIPTDTPVPPVPSVQQVQVSFTADSTSLKAGDCTTLRWSVQFATAVFLDGAGQGGDGQQQVCPPKSTTYNLHVEALSGNVDQSITINVTLLPPSDTNGPVITKLISEPNPTQYGSSCTPGATSTTFRAVVEDSSGVQSVQMVYRYDNGGKVGDWTSVTAFDTGFGDYAATIDNNAGNQAYNMLGGIDGTLTWYVLAQDNLNNPAQSGMQSVLIQYCPG